MSTETMKFGIRARSFKLVMLTVSLVVGVLVGSGFATEESAQSSGLPDDYRIGPRDLLEINVFGLDELNKTVRVSETGFIDLPLLGEIHAAGRTHAELVDEIEKALTRYVRDPEVFVFIREYQSQRYSMLGAVLNPGTYKMEGKTTLLEALSHAGGVDRRESAGTILIIREELADGPLEIDLEQLFDLGNMAFNVELKPGDIINVEPKRVYSIYVYGQVASPGSFDLSEPTTLLKAVTLAGGLTDRAARNRIRIMRAQDDGTQMTIEVNLNHIEEGKKSDIPILPNDVILVPETWF